MSVTTGTVHYGSNMFKLMFKLSDGLEVMYMPTCQSRALSLEQRGVKHMAQTDQRDCQVSHMPCKCVARSRMKKDEVSKLRHYFCKVGGVVGFESCLTMVSYCFIVS